MIYDFCIIGGGIVGLSTAMSLAERRPGSSIVVLEKEPSLGQHQTGHNSWVIHSGIYYAPGSLKADLCRRGAEATKSFCRQHEIPFETRGKLLVATNGIEKQRMDALFERSLHNNVKVDRLDAAELRRLEPEITGVGALFIESTGIVDYRRVANAMSEVIRKSGGTIELNANVTSIRETSTNVNIDVGDRHFTARHMIACAGLQSDRIARLAGVSIEHEIVPFRGEYYQLPPAKNDIVKHLIYPIPNPDLPFLGIHLTRMIDGGVTVGPNAVLGLAREGYPKLSIDVGDVLDFVRFPGFWKVIRKNLKSGLYEMRNSLWKGGYLSECRKYCPSPSASDLLPYPAGIRAQAVMKDGTLVHDFLFVQTERMLHVCNAPSPAATSAIPIGEMIAAKVTTQAIVSSAR